MFRIKKFLEVTENIVTKPFFLMHSFLFVIVQQEYINDNNNNDII